MEALEYLKAIRKLDIRIQSKKLEILSLWELSQSITTTLKDINVSSSGVMDPMADTVAKVIDLQNEIKGEIDQFVEYRVSATRMINQLDSERSAQILIWRYIKYQSWKAIAADLHVSRQYVLALHEKALEAFQKILDKNLGS